MLRGIARNTGAYGKISSAMFRLVWLFVAAHNRLVGGSSPPGPTSPRSFRGLRLGKPDQIFRAVAQRAKAGEIFRKPCEPAHTVIFERWGILCPVGPTSTGRERCIRFGLDWPS
jgi:hypothetical protein